MKRVVAIVGFLPAPIQEFVSWAIYRFARFLVLILVLPVLVVVFIVSTLIFGIVNAVLGPPSGLVGAVLAYAWLASWTVLPVIITVRMWRAIPILRTLVRTATLGPDMPDVTDRALGTLVRHETARHPSFESRVRAADATLTDGDPKPGTDEPPAQAAR